MEPEPEVEKDQEIKPIPFIEVQSTNHAHTYAHIGQGIMLCTCGAGYRSVAPTSGDDVQ